MRFKDKLIRKITQWFDSYYPKHPNIEDGVVEFYHTIDGMKIRGISDGIEEFAQFLNSLDNDFDHVHIEPYDFGNFPSTIDSEFTIIGNAKTSDAIDDLTAFKKGLINITINDDGLLLIEGLEKGYKRLGTTINNQIENHIRLLELTPHYKIFDGQPILTEDSCNLFITILEDKKLPIFLIDDILNWNKFLGLFYYHNKEGLKLLWNHLSKRSKRIIKEYKSKSLLSNEDKDVIISNLNIILFDKFLFHDLKNDTNIKLPEKYGCLLFTNPRFLQDFDVRIKNRLIIENLFSEHIIVRYQNRL